MRCSEGRLKIVPTGRLILYPRRDSKVGIPKRELKVTLNSIVQFVYFGNPEKGVERIYINWVRSQIHYSESRKGS